MDQPIIHHSDVEVTQDAQWLDQMTIRLIQGCAITLGLFFLAGLGRGLWYAGKWAVTHKEIPAASSSTLPPSTEPASGGNQGAGTQPDDKAAAGADKPPVATESQRDDSATQDDTGDATGDSRRQEEPTGTPGGTPQQGDANDSSTDGQNGDSGDTLSDAWDSAKDTARKSRDQAEEWLRHSADKLKRHTNEPSSNDDTNSVEQGDESGQ